jgi:hypothetical protein
MTALGDLAQYADTLIDGTGLALPVLGIFFSDHSVNTQ